MLKGINMKPNHGIFIISLDFELYWGVRDKRSIEQYKNNLKGAREAIPRILQVFNDYNIHATWATVGFLFFKNTEDLKENLPDLTPTYKRKELSPYEYINNSPTLDPTYHFAPDIIDSILESKGQEIGTHTFSHYYCLEPGQSVEEFNSDIETAKNTAKHKDIPLKSLVFPRNQWNEAYLSFLPKHGIQCYRGNEESWIYKASDDAGQNKLQRALRLVDTYLNLSGYNTYNLPTHAPDKPYNLPSSRFLRPHSDKLSFLDGLRLRRIKKAMKFAAINKKVFHLWWHPHNFGANTNENISFLADILKYHTSLNERYGIESLNMSEVCDLIEGGNNGK